MKLKRIIRKNWGYIALSIIIVIYVICLIAGVLEDEPKVEQIDAINYDIIKLEDGTIKCYLLEKNIVCTRK